MKRNRVNIVTLGCSKNTVDSQKLMRQLAAGGYSVTAGSADPADIVIINTCGFGVNRPQEIISRLGLAYREELTGERVITGPAHYAYLKVSEGCERTCAFCAIPDIRGRYISAPLEKLVEEARLLASQGVKELILIAQDLTLYGTDLYGRQMLPGLVRRLAEIDSLEWIRLHYLYPAGFPMEILEIMQENPKICRYIDIPVQHISDKVLKMMRREHDSAGTKRLLADIRRILPDAAVRTTVIAGHPGETEKEYRELLEFIGEYRFDRLGAFRYSHEENTHGALNYKDTIPERTKERRVAGIMKLQQEISAARNASMTGKVIKVIIDRREGLFHVGRSQHDSPEVDQEILVRAAGKIEPGTFADVKITGSTEYDLYAEILQ